MKIPAPHQLRVLNEYAELGVKVEALANFICTPGYTALPEEDKELLRKQYHHMFEYHLILRDRIARF